MRYILKKEMADLIKNKYKNSYFINKLDLSGVYVSLILNRKQPIAKHMAFAFTKTINLNSEISEFFEQVK